MNTSNLILRLFVAVLVKVALEELNKGEKYRLVEEQTCVQKESTLPLLL